eukprot:TRINITY_DN2288_c0_g1_i1.p1 TRINITY_DN2288_c0_g1~~TRINITY_DN2288_c0_g1_i1.p1  ORF type:complete len:871 (+),score=113.79 TRINITY_DN2288_c0_g1_i1:60-2615(+)
MSSFTIRLSVALALLSSCGILLAAGVTAYLTLAFGAEIRRDLKDSRDHGLEMCFTSGRENAKDLSSIVVDAVASSMKKDMENLMIRPYIVCETMRAMLLSHGMDRGFFNTSVRSIQQKIMNSNVKAGINEIAITYTVGGIVDYYLTFEPGETRSNPRPFGVHVVQGAEVVDIAQTDLYALPYGSGFNAYWGQVDDDGQILLIDGNKSKCDHTPPVVGRCLVNPTALGRPLPLWLEKSEIYETPSQPIIWAPLELDKSGLNALSVFTTWRPNNSIPFADTDDWFVASVGVDLNALAAYLRQTRFPGERRYIVYENPWDVGVWELLAMSHGDANYRTMGNITDPVIAAHVADVLKEEGFASVVHKEMDTEWAMNQSLYWAKASWVQTLGGLDMGIILLVPVDEALATIINATNTVAKAIDDENASVDDKQNKLMRTYMPAILTPSLVIMILGFMWFACRITQPLAELSRNMSQVGEMNLEGVSTAEGRSTIEEVRSMQTAFKRMYDSFVEYRNFLPHSMLDQLAMSSEEDEVKSDTSSHRHRRNRATMQSIGASGSSMGSSVYTDYTGITGVSSGGGAAVLQDQVLRKRRITLLATNYCDWHNRFDTESDMSECFNALLPHVLKILGMYQGTPDSFSGDRMLCAFNAVRPLSSHCVAACKALQAIQGVCRETPGAVPLKLTAGVVSGQVLLGNVGCDGMKKFSMFGNRVTTVYALERYSRHVNATSAVANSAFKEAETTFYFRVLDNVLFTKANPLPTPVYELCQQCPMSGTENEWMYQVQDGAASDPWHPWNLAFQYLMVSQPDFTSAERLIDSISKIPTDERYLKQQDTPRNKLVNAIRAREYSPVTILFH